MEIPQFSEDLIKQLDALIPERCPSPGESDRDIWIYVGKRELVRALLLALEAQEREETRERVIQDSRRRHFPDTRLRR